MTRQFWVTLIIVITWVATAIAIFAGQLDVFVSLLITFGVTFYLIIFGLQHTKD